MGVELASELRELDAELEAAERQAEALVAGLSEERGTRRPEPGSWSVSECLDHLATGNRLYLQAMEEPARHARARGRLRRRPARPGWIGRLFIAMLEPPPKWWSRAKAPKRIRPRAAPPLAESFEGFMASQAAVRGFLKANAGLDLAGIRFPNPFVRGVRFSLATGLHVIAAHERRHLQQAGRVRRSIGGGGGRSSAPSEVGSPRSRRRAKTRIGSGSLASECRRPPIGFLESGIR